MSVPDLTPAEWEALGTWVAVVVGAAAVVYAGMQVREARILRREQAKPMVVALMETSVSAAEFVVRNFGPTPAIDVRISADPPLRRTDGSGGFEDVWIPEVIPVLAPGQEWRCWWDSAPERKKSAELANEHRYVATVVYGGVGLDKPECSTSVLDWRAYLGMKMRGRRTVDDVAQVLANVATTLGTWSESVGGGLSVYTRDGAVKDERVAGYNRRRQESHRRIVEMVRRARRRAAQVEASREAGTQEIGPAPKRSGGGPHSAAL